MSAEGLIIDGFQCSKWEIGRKLGAGAFGQVHAIKPASTNAMSCPADKWVIKVCPEPPPSTDKKNASMRAANMLCNEALVYVSTLQGLQGSCLPLLPSRDRPEPLFYSHTADFGFFVMERMQHPLLSIVPMLGNTTSAATKKIAIGPIAARFVAIIQAVHHENILVVNVKPDIFMFAHGLDVGPNCTELASRLRLLDVGVPSRMAFQKMNASTIGNPLYASLNIHDGSTPSWRDDLESIGYVIAEIVIRFVAGLDLPTGTFENGHIPSCLPWSSGKSDEEVGTIKRMNVESLGSLFFARMGKGTASGIIQQYLMMVRSLAYTEKPDYDKLRELLLPLTVQLGEATLALGHPNPPLTLDDHGHVMVEANVGFKRADMDPLDESKPAKKAARQLPPLPRRKMKAFDKRMGHAVHPSEWPPGSV